MADIHWASARCQKCPKILHTWTNIVLTTTVQNQHLHHQVRRLIFTKIKSLKSWLIGKHPDAGRDWGQEGKGTTEDEMAGWHHRLNGNEFEWTPMSWWWTGRPGVLWFMGSQRVGHDWMAELNWTELKVPLLKPHRKRKAETELRSRPPWPQEPCDFYNQWPTVPSMENISTAGGKHRDPLLLRWPTRE